jgi:hypothetical protein
MAIDVPSLREICNGAQNPLRVSILGEKVDDFGLTGSICHDTTKALLTNIFVLSEVN